MSKPETYPVLMELHALRAEVGALRQRVEVLEGRRQKPDPIRDARLVSGIAAVFGGEVFGSADLQVSSDPELRAVLAGISPRALGSWLRRLRRDGAGPYELHRITRDGGGAVWALTVCDDRQAGRRP